MTGELEIIHGMQSLLVTDWSRGAVVFASRYLVFLFVPLIAGLGYIRKRFPLRQAVTDAGWSALLALFTTNILGQLVGRFRPYEASSEIMRLIPSPLTVHAFPSGHTAVAFACAAALTLGSPAWGMVALVLATGVGVGRVFAGVHYPSDVVAGAVLGILCAIVIRWMRVANTVRKSKKSTNH
ncbi:MAG: phosphatase PAP2 family protein [Patescibacteria group bacterium]